MSTNNKILDKIKNLLSLAEDGNNDEESQTALLMAQKLMLKYRISQNEINEHGEQKIVVKSLSVYKRIYWWEKILVRIIAENFRVMFYIQSNRLPHQTSVQRKIVLMGYPEDVELAYEVYHLASKAMRYHASQYIDNHVDKKLKSKSYSNQLRRSYYQGFLDGLDNKFATQRAQMQKDNDQYALIIQTPQDVQEAFQREVKGSLTFRLPESNKDSASYTEGYSKGTNISLSNNYLESSN
ncbi:DUF2786 domain-containing protein [Fundicoccus culcitae]|uniref:DUF2786 domain-containing protein n=1 Tax=Fundicoccus culcitae TaxID=2969821 RepID=A0ABY5P7Z1_9LACT|nr:DUF2786 domain-containing protein [Fundicoccus culcitae]UUX34513.1 DUF2786 domain-containing protein [Fundicoccus culcitae]